MVIFNSYVAVYQRVTISKSSCDSTGKKHHQFSNKFWQSRDLTKNQLVDMVHTA